MKGNCKCQLAKNIAMCLGDNEEQHICCPELKRNRSAKQYFSIMQKLSRKAANISEIPRLEFLPIIMDC